MVPAGREALRSCFERFFRDLARKIPAPLRRRLDIRVCFDPAGLAAGCSGPRFAGGKLDLTAPASDDQWDVRLRLDDWALWRVVSGADTWQSLGISCRYRASLRRGARDREVFFWFVLYLHDLGYLWPGDLLTPRALRVLLQRRRELREHAQSLVTGRFVESSLRGKFVA